MLILSFGLVSTSWALPGILGSSWSESGHVWTCPILSKVELSGMGRISGQKGHARGSRTMLCVNLSCVEGAE